MSLLRVMSLVCVVCAAHGREECKGMQCRGADDDVGLLQLAKWPWHNKWIDGVSTCLHASATSLVAKLTNVSIWDEGKDEGFAGNFIDDAVDDMYDDGNFVSIAVSGKGFSPALPYTQQCDGTWTHSGYGDVEYFTCRVDVATGASNPTGNATVWFAGFRSKQGSIEGLSIAGEFGSDGEGNALSGRVPHPVGGHYGLYSQTNGTSDPSINHLVITECDGWQGTYTTGNPISGDPDSGRRRNRRRDGLRSESDLYVPKWAGKPVTNLLYVLWGGGFSDDTLQYSPADFQAALESVTAKC